MTAGSGPPAEGARASGVTGRVVVVTGGAQGIGAVVAASLAEAGARVAVGDLHAPDDTVERIRDAGGEAVGGTCDISDRHAVAAFVDGVVTRYGGVDGLVNNAAVFSTLSPRPFEDIPSEEFDRVLSTNVRGTFEMIRAVSPTMRRQRYGKIVNIGSGTAFKGTPMLLHYVTSKGAVVALTRALAREVGSAGIRVNCVAPGLTSSDGVKLHPENFADEMQRATIESRCLPREQEPRDLCGAIAFLLSSASDFMTGQTLLVDGGSVMH